MYTTVPMLKSVAITNVLFPWFRGFVICTICICWASWTPCYGQYTDRELREYVNSTLEPKVNRIQGRIEGIEATAKKQNDLNRRVQVLESSTEAERTRPYLVWTAIGLFTMVLLWLAVLQFTKPSWDAIR